MPLTCPFPVRFPFPARGRARLGGFAAALLGVATAALAAPTGADRVSNLPNVVVIFPDDMGYGDLGVQGAKGFQTPNLDRLAAEGRRFTNFYVAEPVCSASRAALLTGCYAVRLGIRGALSPRDNHGIHPDETTLAELLKSRGYVCGIFGKWHLGHHRPFLPLQHGFDEYYGIPYSNDMWPHNPMLARLPANSEARKAGYPNLPLFEGNEVVDDEVTPEDQTRLTSGVTERAVAFIEKYRNRPFFLYVPHPMPHVPLFVSEKFKGSSEQGLYGDVIQEIDWSVGEIMQAIHRWGLDEKTFVVFLSDNGPWTVYGNHAGSTGGLREAKGTTFEGGVRVPCIMRWPGRIPAGTVCDEPLMTIDLLPTIARLINAKMPELPIDGRDAWPVIEGKEGARCPHPAYFFYYNAGDLEAMRSGVWKLHFPHKYRTIAGEPGSDGAPGAFDQKQTGLELYNLAVDPSESNDLAAARPEIIARLTSLADQVRQELGDRLTGIEGKGIRPAARLENQP